MGKVAHFFGLPLCQCCRFILWGFYPIGAGLEHCNCIGSSGRGYQLANAVPIKATGTPIPCHWRIKFQVTNENQSKRLDFQSLTSEGRWSANPAVFQKLCGPISLATRIQLECQWSATQLPIDCQWNTNWFQWSANGVPIDYHWSANGMPMECQLTTTGVPLQCQWTTNGKPIGPTDIKTYW